MGWGGVWVQLFEGQGAGDHVILVLCECISDAPAVSLVFPAFDDTGSLGYPPRMVVYPHGCTVPPWVIAYRFLEGNREAKLKSLLLFRVFLSFFFF